MTAALVAAIFLQVVWFVHIAARSRDSLHATEGAPRGAPADGDSRGFSRLFSDGSVNVVTGCVHGGHA
jgi:hypothetical protein